MALANRWRQGRKQQKQARPPGRHQRDGGSLDLPVPEAQVRATSGPQPAYSPRPETGPQPAYSPRPETGPQPAYSPRPETGPQQVLDPASHPYPPAAPHGTHPFAAPVHPDVAQQERQPRQQARTESWRPDFANRASKPRPYVPLMLIRPLPPAQPVLFSRDPQVRQQEVAGAAESVASVAYPPPDLSDQYGHAVQYAALMRHYDRLTGYPSPLSDPAAWPVPQAPVVPCRGLAITAGDAA